MGHNPTTSGKKVERKQAQETRTSEEIINTLRKNIPNQYIAILKTDVAVLMAAYDLLLAEVTKV